ncbi:glycine betaine ABC transporter substrate-binding protein [Orrella marina]|uniref:glycine betaine ABC transporter substrate-binding protein n=1 Tax=Orrella marina TaxID=2163011 RepID=UPI00131EE3D6|nr:glycine betaine ABC transporter substrate-binding protein [Orrella marina]
MNDPEIVDYELYELADSTRFFPTYQAAPLTSKNALTRTPEIESVINLLAGKINHTRMRELNAAVSLDGGPVHSGCTKVFVRIRPG